ncbi:MAG: nuclear transport factor 2 family protein [Acidobacteriota bacterium]
MIGLRLALAVAVLLWSSVSQGASAPNEQDAVELGKRYLEALYEADLHRLAALTTEDLLFVDDTSAALPGGPWRFEGREAVFDFFRGSVESVDSSGFEVEHAFSAGNQVVFELVYLSQGDAAPFGSPGTRIELRVPAVTVLEVREGVVAKHHDHIDYETLMAQVDRQVSAARSDSTSPSAASAQTASTSPTRPQFPQPNAVEVAALRNVADRYLEAVWSFDYATMASLLAEDVLYEDYTAEYFDIEPYRFQGRDAVLDFYRTANASSGTQEVVPEVRESFVAGSNVVVLVDITATVDGKDWGVPGKRLVGSGLTVTWLRIREGRISRHIDFADFDSAIRGFERASREP